MSGRRKVRVFDAPNGDGKYVFLDYRHPATPRVLREMIHMPAWEVELSRVPERKRLAAAVRCLRRDLVLTLQEGVVGGYVGEDYVQETIPDEARNVAWA